MNRNYRSHSYRLITMLLLGVLSMFLTTSAEAKVRLVVRSHWFNGIGGAFSNVFCYASGTNDGTAYVSGHAPLGNAATTSFGRGASYTGNHSYTGGQLADVILSDGLAFSSVNPGGASDHYRLWDLETGSLVYSNTSDFGGPYTYAFFAPMHRVRSAVGGEIPAGSMVAINPYTWGDGLAVFHRDGVGFKDLPRFRVGFKPVPAGTPNFSPRTGLTNGVHYWGSEMGNYHLAASLKDGTILCGYTGNTNVWVVNPGNGANTNFVFDANVSPLQGIVAMPDGTLGLVGGNRTLRFYEPTYTGAQIPVMGAVIKAVDLPGTAWIADACAFKDGTIGIMINYDQTTNDIPKDRDVVERWDISGATPEYLETMTLLGSYMSHPCGDSAISFPVSTQLIVR